MFDSSAHAIWILSVKLKHDARRAVSFPDDLRDLLKVSGDYVALQLTHLHMR